MGKAPLIGGRPLSPVHYSPTHGVHADIGLGSGKVHVPFYGQTTLPTFRVGGRPDYANDARLAGFGGTLGGVDITGGRR